MINHYERAAKAWPILMNASSNKKLITYKDLSDLIGVHHRTARYYLEIIQNYCLEMNLPPLTILAVNQKGIQGLGFTACERENIECEKQRVYRFDWRELNNPFNFALNGSDLSDLIYQVLKNPNESKKVYSTINDRGVAQIMFRNTLMKVYQNKCAVCGNSINELLEACHIIPWSKCTDEQKIDPRNGILMCRNHHSLFDKGLLNIDKQGRIQFDNRVLNNHSYKYIHSEIQLNGSSIQFPRKQEWKPNLNT